MSFQAFNVFSDIETKGVDSTLSSFFCVVFECIMLYIIYLLIIIIILLLNMI